MKALSRLQKISRVLRDHGMPFVIYVLCLVTLFGFVATTLTDLVSEQDSLQAAQSRLASLVQSRARPGAAVGGETDRPGTGPLLATGEKATLAGAELQNQLTSLVSNLGGRVVSAQVETDPSRETFSKLILSLEIAVSQAALQSLMYTIESATPLQFIEQLDIRPSKDAGVKGELQVSLRVSTLWHGATP